MSTITLIVMLILFTSFSKSIIKVLKELIRQSKKKGRS